MTWEDRINVLKIDFCLNYIRLYFLSHRKHSPSTLQRPAD